MNHSNQYLLLFICLSCVFIEIGMSLSSIAALNEYETNSDTYWISKSYFKPKQGFRYGQVKRRKSMYFTLKFMYYGKTNWNQWENILRIGEYGNGSDSGCNEHGMRFPGLYILPSNDGLQVSLSDKSECWFVIEKNYKLQKNIIYNLTIAYNQTQSTVSISANNATNNDIILPFHIISNKSRTTDDRLLNKSMDIIISDPLTMAANALLWDIMILSYDDILTFPTESPTNAPTMAPINRPERPDEDFDVQVTVAMDYSSSNNSNKSDTDEIIRDITEDIMNTYINNNTEDTIHVVISDIENKQYDIILLSNYTTNNETAVELEALVQNQLETELLERIIQNNAINGSIIHINDIQIEIILIDHSNNKQQPIDIYSTQTTQITNVSAPENTNKIDLLLWSIIIGACFVMFCIFMIGFYVGIKCNGYKKVNARQNRVKSKSSVGVDENINVNEYSEHAHINNISDEMLKVMVTPIKSIETNGLQIVDNVNNIQLNHQLNQYEMDDDDDDIEDMYTNKNKYKKAADNINYVTPNGTMEGTNVNTKIE